MGDKCLASVVMVTVIEEILQRLHLTLQAVVMLHQVHVYFDLCIMICHECTKVRSLVNTPI